MFSKYDTYNVTYRRLSCDHRCSIDNCLDCRRWYEGKEETQQMTSSELVDFIKQSNVRVIKVESRNTGIFQNVKFGDKFVTKNGQIVIYVSKYDYQDDVVYMLVLGKGLLKFSTKTYSPLINGTDNNDLTILRRCKPSIDNTELDALAYKFYLNKEQPNERDKELSEVFKQGYRFGFEKALE